MGPPGSDQARAKDGPFSRTFRIINKGYRNPRSTQVPQAGAQEGAGEGSGGQSFLEENFSGRKDERRGKRCVAFTYKALAHLILCWVVIGDTSETYFDRDTAAGTAAARV